MNNFIWQQSFEIGDEIIDSQHQHLFDLANQLSKANDNQETARLMMLFYRYIREHFFAEEDIMKKVDFPEYARHVDLHDKILHRLSEISLSAQQESWDPGELNSFVNDWLSIHILKEDLHLGRYLKSL